jgi:hypothetical protein
VIVRNRLQIGCRVLRSIARKVKAVYGSRGRFEPGIAGAGQADAEVHAVARHRRDQAAVRDAVRASSIAFAGRHRQIEEEVIVARDERQRLRELRLRHRALQRGGHQLLQQQARCRRIAVVAFIAHVQRLCDERLQLERSVRGQHFTQRWREHLSHPAQALQHFVSMCAEAQHLAESFVETGKRALAVGAVLDHPHRHRRADDAGHRAHRAVLMAWRKSDCFRRPASLRACSTSAAQPSYRIAPQIAPCIGPHIFSNAIGGPACSSIRPAMPGNADAAGAMPTSTGCAAR